MSGSPLLEEVVSVSVEVPSSVVEELARVAEGLDGGHSHRLKDAMSSSPVHGAASRLASAWAGEPEVSGRELAAMLRAASARGAADASHRVEVVVTGPSTIEVPTRLTEVVVGRVVAHARHDLLLVTYAAWPYPPVLEALAEAVGRGVVVRVVVETAQGSQGFLDTDPAHAFASVPGIHLLQWPLGKRPGPHPGRMHAKVAVADREMAFVTSANLTGAAQTVNLECGLLVRGGTAPARIRDHFAALQHSGVLVSLAS